MRRLVIFISLVLLCCGCASVQPQVEGGGGVEVARVPDKVFRAYLVEQGYAEPYRGPMRRLGFVVPRREVLRRTAMGRALQLLNVHNMGIGSLEGVEMFDSLVVLICSENPLRSVDLSHCPRLKQFTAIETPLEQLDLSLCPELKLIELSYTRLQQLDVSRNPLLEEIFCIFSPGIDSIDISHNPRLRRLYIRETRIREVDISGCPEFEGLYALDTPLATLYATEEQLDRVGAVVEDSVKVHILPEK